MALCKITVSCLSLVFGELFSHPEMVLFKHLENWFYNELHEYFRSIQVVWGKYCFGLVPVSIVTKSLGRGTTDV